MWTTYRYAVSHNILCQDSISVSNIKNSKQHNKTDFTSWTRFNSCLEARGDNKWVGGGRQTLESKQVMATMTLRLCPISPTTFGRSITKGWQRPFVLKLLSKEPRWTNFGRFLWVPDSHLTGSWVLFHSSRSGEVVCWLGYYEDDDVFIYSSWYIYKRWWNSLSMTHPSSLNICSKMKQTMQFWCLISKQTQTHVQVQHYVKSRDTMTLGLHFRKTNAVLHVSTATPELICTHSQRSGQARSWT